MPTGTIKSAGTPPPTPDYDLLRQIGRGSYGEVWLARGVTGSFRALKIVRREFFEHDRPFEREFDGILQFEPISRGHESQVDILHIGRGEGYFYYVMELADDQFTGQQINPESYAARTLKSDLFQRGSLHFEECIQISLALATALHHLHSHGLVHRDVKPSNIIFVNGVPKLADIGLVTGIDTTRSFVGTEGFAPAEGPGTPQADIYSLGKVLYEMATGKDRQDFPELPTNVAALAESEGLIELNAVIAKACRHNPSERYKSAENMRKDLLLLQGGRSLAKLHAVERRMQRLKRWSFAMLAFAILVSAGLFYQTRQSRIVRELAQETARMLEEKTTLAYASDINLAQDALEENNFGRAIELLTRQRDRAVGNDLRGWEWRFLWGQSRSDSLYTLSQPSAWVKSVSFSTDGKWLAAGEFDSRTTVWDLKSRSILKQFSGQNMDPITAFSRHAPLLAFVAPTNQITLWDAEKQDGQSTLSLDARPSAIAFSKDGKFLVTATSDNTRGTGTLSIWRLDDKKPLKVIRIGSRGTSPILNNIVLAGDVSFAAYATSDTVHVIDLATEEERWWAVAADEKVLSMALSEDNTMLATGGGWAEPEIRLWSVASGKEIGRFTGHTGFVPALMFRNSDTELISGSGDQTIRQWDVRSREARRVLRGHRSEVWALAMAPDEKTMASGGKDGAICFWDLTSDRSARREIRLPGAHDYWWCSTDAGKVITTETNGAVVEWKGPAFSEGKTLGLLPPRRSPLISPDGRLLLNGGTNGVVRIHAMEDFQVLKEFSAGAGFVRPIVYVRPKNIYWILDHAGEVLRAFDGTSFAPASGINEVSMKDAYGFDVSRDGRWFLRVSYSGRSHRVDLETGTESEAKLDITDVSDTTFSPDGEMFAVASTRGIVRIFETGSFQEVFSIRSFLLGVTSVMFSPDGETILAGNPGGGYALKIWHVPSRQEILSLPGEGSDFTLTRFSEDGRLLGTLNAKGKLHLWQAPSWREIIELEKEQKASAVPQLR